jgi:hypothetical protein
MPVITRRFQHKTQGKAMLPAADRRWYGRPAIDGVPASIVWAQGTATTRIAAQTFRGVRVL